MNNDFYTTSDTPLAAWLLINGIKRVSTDFKANPVVFVFDSRGQDAYNKVNDLIFQWDSGIAVGNCNSFYKSYRTLIHEMKEVR